MRFRKDINHNLEAIKQIKRIQRQSPENIKSVGTNRNYVQSLKLVSQHLYAKNYGDLNILNKKIAEKYLNDKKDIYAQKNLDLHRQAMQKVINLRDNPRQIKVIKSTKILEKSARAYSKEHVQEIIKNENEYTSIPIELAFKTGLRAHEMLTLNYADVQRAHIRETHKDKFFNMRNNHIIYTVNGKGGLIREVAIDNDLARRLEERRLENAEKVTDRNIYYQKNYDIAGGKELSNKFSKLSNEKLSYSNGLHGLRHSYAQNRLELLQYIHEYKEALKIVSLELGHFRAEITKEYLR